MQSEDIYEIESLKLAAINSKMKENDAQDCLKLMEDTKVKDTLKKTTEEAIEQGVKKHWQKFASCPFKKVK